MTAPVSRRRFLQASAGAGLFAALVPERLAWALGSAPPPGAAGRFLTAHELSTLRAITDRLIPGPGPTDSAPGAAEAQCAEAIDALLGAFTFTPPLIHAGAPFSDRAGAKENDVAHFVPLDAQAELGWRIRLEGSQNKPERLFAGPVTGLQETYRNGLADLDKLAPPDHADFLSAPPDAQDALLRDDSVMDFVQTVLSDCLDAFFGLPEYRGNVGLVGWKLVGWPGDVEPRGFTDEQVSTVDPGSASPIDGAAMRTLLPQLLPGAKVV